jgi:predicted transcriptional regulator YdeE
MEIITIGNDIPVMYITASSFPEGVLTAHQSLHALIPFSEKRRYFGLSRPEGNGDIIYRAAAEETYDGEARELGLEVIKLKKGRYVSLLVENYMKDISSIGKAFQALLAHPDIDPQGYCVELYVSQTDVQCMVRLA